MSEEGLSSSDLWKYFETGGEVFVFYAGFMH